jgi:hypothetical protein
MVFSVNVLNDKNDGVLRRISIHAKPGTGKIIYFSE